MVNRLRNTIGHYLLKSAASRVKRNRSMFNLAGAKSIGILYPLFDLQDYSIIEAFVSELQKENKEVKALGCLQHKELISRFLPKLSYDFFSHQEVNWYFKPKNTRVDSFIRTEFDLLIDLTINDHLPLRFIAGLSIARCKVGRFSEESMKYHDLMIKVDSITKMPELITLIRHYLSIIQQHE